MGALKNCLFRSLERGASQLLQRFSRPGIDKPWYFRGALLEALKTHISPILWGERHCYSLGETDCWQTKGQLVFRGALFNLLSIDHLSPHLPGLLCGIYVFGPKFVARFDCNWILLSLVFWSFSQLSHLFTCRVDTQQGQAGCQPFFPTTKSD